MSLVEIGTIPPPLSPASVPLPMNQRVGAHSPAGEGFGESQFRRLKKSLELCLLYAYMVFWEKFFFSSY
jgi:hypothetical protein